MGSLDKVKRDGKECCDEVVMIEVAPAKVDDANPRVPQRKDVGGHHHWGQSSSADPGDSKSVTNGRWSQSSDDLKSVSSGGQTWGQNVATDPKSPTTRSSSQMLGLLEEFTKIYSDRLQRVEETAMKSNEKQYLESKVCVLESWVRDLGEQNAILVTTVEELEKEAADRVALLEDRLAKMATTTRESCVSLRDHQVQVSSLVAHKLDMERETQGLGDKLVSLERNNHRLNEENNNLQSDLNNLVQVISRARVTGQWEADDLTFSCVTPEQIFGPVLSSSRRSSQSLKDSQRDYIHQMLEDHLKKDNSSIRSSFSNLQDADSSIYGSRGSDKDVLIMKLKADLRCSQSANEEINCQLVERDKQIADLQAQLTEMHHKLAESQAEVHGVTRALQELRHHNRHESIEVSRKEEVIRHLLCKTSKKDSIKRSYSSICDLDTAIIGENNVEAQLSENIDILASRLAELEEECQQLRDQHSALQDTHSLCAPTITMLQDQLSRSQQTQVELRTVLTAEVAERHDQVISLKDQLKEQEQSHHESQMQLQLRNEVIKDLRKAIKELKERVSSPNAKNSLPPVQEEYAQHDKETKSSETQTCRIDTLDIGAMTEQSGIPLPNGFYPSNSSQSPQLSKLQNELAEKNVLLRELQSHLASSRQEVHLKDETLYKLEQKLNSSRREDGQKGERMQYLTGQLTSLQLEVGRTHGQAEHLRRQVENKNEILQKMESENSSLTTILNEKSATLERFQNEILNVSEDLAKRKKEVADQRVTISTLQDALVTSKRTCDELRLRLDNDVASRESEANRLERDLKAAHSLHHKTFTQLVESDARGEVLQEENRALSRRVTVLQEDLKLVQSHDTRQSDRTNREKEQLRRQLQETERRCKELTTTVQLLQGQVQTLEEEVTAATEARSEADRRATEAQRKNIQLQETLSAQETSESVERLGRQLEETVLALTMAREEALNKAEQLRQAKQDVSQLSDALSYEKELNANLHEQMESLVKVAGSHEHRTAEQQQELRKIIRDAMQKERKIATLEAQVEGFKNQISALEELVTEEEREVASLNDSLVNESKLLQQTRTKLDVARKDAIRGEEQADALRKDLQHSQDKISRQEQRIKEMESEHEAEIAALAERLTLAHEASVRRLEDTLLTYTRLQAHDEFQVENLEESLRELGARLAESELRAKELERERESLGRSLHQEQSRREEDSQEHQRQIIRLTEETTLLRARLEGVQEETLTWQRQCEDLEERHQHADGGGNVHSQLIKAQHQVESLREALMSAKLETRAAEEERGHAHEQVLSLIRECNALEEQIHRLTKEKNRLQDQLSCKEADISALELDYSTASCKDELGKSAEKIYQLEKELAVVKNGKGIREGCSGADEVMTLKDDLKKAQTELKILREMKDWTQMENLQSERFKTLQEEVKTLKKYLKEAERRESQLKEQLQIHSMGSCNGVAGEILASQLRSEIAAARRESSEARRMLLERESQGRMTQLKVTTLQKMLQDRELEVSSLEEKLTESQAESHRAETEVARLQARVATLTTQLNHTQAQPNKGSANTANPLLPHAEKVASLENEISRQKEDLAVKSEELNQMCEKENRNVSKIQELEQNITRATKAKDETLRKVVSLEGSLAEAMEASEATKAMEKMWEAQLATIQQEVSRLLCETTQLKECNVSLHDQLSASQSDSEHLRSEIRSKDAHIDELQHARDLLANDAQVVVAAVKQWLHEQKTANTKLASKLHQQNKQILLLNTEKQFLAERNTSLQRANHELSLQLHDLRARIGLPLLSSSEKISKPGGLSFGGSLGSPRVLSPLGGGGSSRLVSTTPPLDMRLGPSLDSVFCHSTFSDKLEDGFSTCSSEGSSGGGCHVPGPDLPGTLQLERLAQLADSLLLASRSITRNTSLMQGHKSSRMTSATSLGDLTSTNSFSHARSSLGHARRASSSVGNLSLLSPVDFKDKPVSPCTTKFSYRFSDCTSSFYSPGSKIKGGEMIMVPPVRERKPSHHLFNNHSIEEAEEEDVGCSAVHSAPPLGITPASRETSPTLSNPSLPSSPTTKVVVLATKTAQATQTFEIGNISSCEESSA